MSASSSARRIREQAGDTDSSKSSSRPSKRIRTGDELAASVSPNTARSTTGVGAESGDTGGAVEPIPVPTPAERACRPESGLAASLPHIEEAAEPEPAAAAAHGPYTSSLYTDAFELALDTVLAEESHLFDEAEAEIFQRFRSLPYEARYLYVRLFLRKSGAWFRTSKFSYQSNISDIPAACELLCSPDIALAQQASDAVITLDEAANLLTLEELRPIAKDDQVNCSNKAQIISALKAKATTQGRLRVGQTGLLGFGFGGEGQEEKKYINRLLDIAGPCIRLNSDAASLFHKVHLVFYRSTEYTESSLTTLILARTTQHKYPHYIVSRTSNIFASRAVLVEFEEAIKLQAKVDLLLEQSGAPTPESLQQVLDIAEGVWPRWKELVEQERAKVKTVTSSFGDGVEVLVERIYLRRFSPAWVFTRILHKGLLSLARAKNYIREHLLLTELLSQKFYHTARRGAWYQRKALLEERYHSFLPTPPDVTLRTENEKKRYWHKKALETCCAGLEDPLTHITFHLDLQKRLKKIEQSHLKIPHRQQHDFSHLSLLRPTTTRTFTGDRVSPCTLGRKTIWRHPYPPTGDENSTCSVEEMCLSRYKNELGWEGFHSESTIILTLFAHLFYDILFLYVPNVFETEYQTCPLDLFTEAFYPTRASEINHRLVEIENGKAREIIEGVWDREGERKPHVVGLDWNLDKQTLCDIVQCFPGQGLAMICKVLCQEYQQRSRGIPDLFLWSVERKECMFAEVKSENDRLSDAQRLWIHVLSTAGIKTELCLAVAAKEEEEAQVKKEKAVAWKVEQVKDEDVDVDDKELGRISA
ncbi:coiled-coil domain-containing protein MTMR15 [Peziza echinospora]|nr:coiled-coil domain-containing protein MTMR15 [Peziza echinospora]